MPLQETIMLFKPGFELFYYPLAALKAMGDGCLRHIPRLTTSLYGGKTPRELWPRPPSRAD